MLASKFSFARKRQHDKHLCQVSVFFTAVPTSFRIPDASTAKIQFKVGQKMWAYGTQERC